MLGLFNLIKHKYFGAAATVAMLIMLPVALFISQQPQDPRGLADDATVLSFSPISSPTVPITSKAGDEFSLNVMVEPKNNFVNRVNIVVSYDPNFVEPAATNPLVVNSEFFPDVTQGPIYNDGTIEIMLSVGSDLTKSISIKT